MLARTACVHQRVRIVPQLGREQRLAPTGRTRSTIERRLRDWFCGRPLQLFERRQDRAALRVAEHHDQPRAEALGGELDAADLRRRDDVAGDADDEQVAEPLVEHDLGRHARVRAAEDDRERLLRRGQPVVSVWLVAAAVPHVVDEAAVTLRRSSAADAEIINRLVPRSLADIAPLTGACDSRELYDVAGHRAAPAAGAGCQWRPRHLPASITAPMRMVLRRTRTYRLRVVGVAGSAQSPLWTCVFGAHCHSRARCQPGR